ncbi:MAG: prephenate dehydrogenase/arogenate dehydrogenase family protein [Dehalococcoidia bacterium]
MVRLAIIGLGLIGGSFGLALKRERPDDFEIVGCAATRETRVKARKRGVIDVEARSAAEAVAGAAFVFIATPISAVRAVLEEIAPALADGAIVTDAASTKRDVLRWADELLPERVQFVGGHPIAGKEESGIEVADAALFEQRPWAIVPSRRASEQSVLTIERLVQVVGATPVSIDAEEHDSYLAAVSHLPLFASIALFSLARESQAWPDLAVLAGPGFGGATRLASTNPALSHDITLTNRDNVVHWLDRYIDELRRLRALVADEAAIEELIKTLATAQTERDRFVSQPQVRKEQPLEGESLSAGDQMRSILIGDFASRRLKEMGQIMEPDDKERR